MQLFVLKRHIEVYLGFWTPPSPSMFEPPSEGWYRSGVPPVHGH